MNKKAQVEVSFNWIFVLIAGFAIMMFFIMLINNRTESSQEDLAKTITERMSNIFESIQSNPNTAQLHQRANYELEFSCREGVHEFRQIRSSSSQYLENSIVFTPRIIGNSQLATLTLRENLPFLTTSTLLLTDTNTHYVFNSALTSYHNWLPSIFSKSIGGYSDAENAARDHRKVVYVTTPTDSSTSTQNIDVIKINTSNGQIIFEDGNSLNFFSQEMALGAIITGEYELANCNFQKINQSFERMKFVLSERKDNISDKLSANCQSLYNNTNIDLDFNLDLPTFRTKSIELDQRNRELERLGCPTIY